MRSARLEDPRARSSLTFSLAYVLALMSEYREALELAYQAQADVEAFDLEFARPHSNSNLAFIYMGLRRFGAAERCLQLVEDASSERPHRHPRPQCTDPAVPHGAADRRTRASA